MKLFTCVMAGLALVGLGYLIWSGWDDTSPGGVFCTVVFCLGFVLVVAFVFCVLGDDDDPRLNQYY